MSPHSDLICFISRHLSTPHFLSYHCSAGRSFGRSWSRTQCHILSTKQAVIRRRCQLHLLRSLQTSTDCTQTATTFPKTRGKTEPMLHHSLFRSSKQNLSNIVVFVIRQFGGQHLGAKRFDCIKSCAEKVIKESKIKWTYTCCTYLFFFIMSHTVTSA